MKKTGSADSLKIAGKGGSPERRKSVHFGSDTKSNPSNIIKNFSENKSLSPVKEEEGSPNFLAVPKLSKNRS